MLRGFECRVEAEQHVKRLNSRPGSKKGESLLILAVLLLVSGNVQEAADEVHVSGEISREVGQWDVGRLQ